MFCPVCGTRCLDEWAFCAGCGNPFHKSLQLRRTQPVASPASKRPTMSGLSTLINNILRNPKAAIFSISVLFVVVIIAFITLQYFTNSWPGSASLSIEQKQPETMPSLFAGGTEGFYADTEGLIDEETAHTYSQYVHEAQDAPVPADVYGTHEYSDFDDAQFDYIPQSLPDGHQVAEDFLLQFHSIFLNTMPTTGWGLEEGQFSYGWETIYGEWQQIISYDVPSMYYNSITGHYYDRYGNRFDADTPWIHGGRHANGFMLFDFDLNGIPDILILSSTGHHEWYGYLPHTLYRFIDGEYRRVYLQGDDGHTSFFPYSSFYHDPDGNLIGHAHVQLSAMGGAPSVFSLVTLDGSYASLSPLYRQRHVIYNNDYAYAVWRNYVTGEDYIPMDDPQVSQWYSSLVPARRLMDMEEEIIASILWRLSVG